MGFTFPGMIEEPGSFSGIDKLGEPGARTAGHQPDIIRDLVERDGECAQRARQVDECVVSALHRELVRRADERQISQLRDFSGGSLAKSRGRINAGSHCCTTERQFVNTFQRIFDAREIIAEHADVPRPLLSECDRRGILHVRATDLNDVPPLLALVAIASRSAVTAGISRSFTFTAAAMFIAVGNVSFDDCDMLTWSFG